MNDCDCRTLEQIRCFLQRTEWVAFRVQGNDERYAWTEHTLQCFHDRTLGKAARGLVRCFIERISGLSRAQVTRLVRQYRHTGRVRRAQRTTRPFRTRFTGADVRALAKLDERHRNYGGTKGSVLYICINGT